VPELVFKGKKFVFDHHLAVPYRPLEMDSAKSIAQPALNGNVIVHGDNLHALKALLPFLAFRYGFEFVDLDSVHEVVRRTCRDLAVIPNLAQCPVARVPATVRVISV
jgi:hypothetical protein